MMGYQSKDILQGGPIQKGVDQPKGPRGIASGLEKPSIGWALRGHYALR